MFSDIDRPIIIVGAGRSGTNLLASILELHHEVAYLAEPNYIWKYSNAWLGHDMIPSWRATPSVRSYIRQRFAEFCREAGKTRLCEKTPANSIRLAFVMQVVPDAKIIHLVRDGRAVVASARKKIYGDITKISRINTTDSGGTTRRSFNYKILQRILKLARRRLEVGVPGRDFVFYLPHFVNTTLNICGLRKKYLWGPRIPGLKQLFRSHRDVEVAAIQWRASVESVLNYVENHPEMNYHEVRYEDLCADPVNVARRIYEFCELEMSPKIEEKILAIFAASSRIAPLKLPMSQQEEQLVNDYIAHTLKVLGYTAADAVGNCDKRTASV